MTTYHFALSCVVILLGTLLSHSQGLHLMSSPLLRDAEALEDAAAVLLGLDGDSMLVKKRAGTWYSPRLGRRDRRSVDELETDQDEVAEFLKDAPWALVPIKGGKRQTLTLTPRLGRDSSEEEEQDASSLMEQRSPPFAPRLGRRLVPFAPRLGRDQVYRPRLGRSTAPAATPGNNKQH
ncbi:PBAN-type neuropeptides [Anabrus simplex]|uniref:PBAN-type neuropeptides n=1 Tax=Anabrus simplex TaxID=316456 RepID=UPI0035A27956